MSNGENAFLDWLARQDSPADFVSIGIGDDCAAVRIGNEELLVTTDMLLDGVHFDSEQHTPEQIGRKAIACSLSDLAAMAARPVAAVIAAGATRGRGMDYAKRIYAGARQIAEAYACPIIGGDTTSWPRPMSICVTMLGQCPEGRTPIRRNGARPGDAIYVTGPLGGSILGKHLSFEPRIELADRLAQCCELHAMMDISDGLAIDLSRICKASGVGAVLEESLLETAISDAARELSARDGIPALHHTLHDGEDFELLVIVPEHAFDTDIPEEVIRVGDIAESGLHLRLPDGTSIRIVPAGYEHHF